MICFRQMEDGKSGWRASSRKQILNFHNCCLYDSWSAKCQKLAVIALVHLLDLSGTWVGILQVQRLKWTGQFKDCWRMTVVFWVADTYITSSSSFTKRTSVAWWTRMKRKGSASRTSAVPRPQLRQRFRFALVVKASQGAPHPSTSGT